MKRRRILYIVLPVLILFLLIPGGIVVYYLLANPTEERFLMNISSNTFWKRERGEKHGGLCLL